MTTTMTVEIGDELKVFIDEQVKSGKFQSHNEVIRAGLLLLKEKHAESNADVLRHLVEEGEDWGVAEDWGADKS